MGKTFDFNGYFSEHVNALKTSGRYRTFLTLRRRSGFSPLAEYQGFADSKPATVWCGCDYLGMGQHPRMANALMTAADEYGAGSGGSRNIAGTSPYHVLLERELADLHSKERALVFSSGYAANQSSLEVVGRTLPDPIFFSDELNHASLIQGIRASKCRKMIFRHNDPEHLDALLAEAGPDVPKIVVTESIFSMEGDIAPLTKIADVASHHGALTYLDEVHAVGVYGPQGAGIAAELGLEGDFTLIQGSLAKAYGTIGGYVTGPEAIVDTIRSHANPFIFTISTPPAMMAAALASVRYLRNSEDERRELRANSRLLADLLVAAGIPLVSDKTHILPVMVGDTESCVNISQSLLSEHGIYVQPINFPSVPAGTDRLRVSPTAVHRKQDVHEFATALNEEWSKLKLARTSG